MSLSPVHPTNVNRRADLNQRKRDENREYDIDVT